MGLHAKLRQRGNRLIDLPLVARANRDVAAFPCQRFGNGAADAARAAGDDCLLALEPEIHGVSPSFTCFHLARL